MRMLSTGATALIDECFFFLMHKKKNEYKQDPRE